ncbi:betaine/proline/choline family ABC transporter ATP-binding protein [Solicola gregarius]|uniref:ABC-type quaternary amine transporter n=1 Tax=Solicola gregarius TaxID=2908642 RepID=A0AA46TMA8_9ACTN|nr:betaine/proline/choline family ABC transporter ATP-binding protein [Solicola gregarius]
MRLEGVTKRYRGQQEAAVDDVTMEIPAGEIVMLVGPSGCGKTTTMKMINRLIEPTDGRILIGDEDVTHKDPDDLRRSIGYVIQGAGLFPHYTVGDNIGLVPKMLKWDAKRIRERVDEMLDLVSLDPDMYRNRYPRELSGGQQQRIGVARALAADPPVMLMDEPFGAVDPITRQRLQDELLSLQDELRKTIVFVTHDFDEAVKMGDRIAILNVGAEIVQYDTPDQILTNPASDFVESFIGHGAALKQLTLTRVRDVELHDAATTHEGDDPADAARKVREIGREHVLVLDDRDRPQRWLSLRDLEVPGRLDRVARDRDLDLVSGQSTLNDALDVMLTSSHGVVVVTGPRNRYEGVVRVETIMGAMSSIETTSAGPSARDTAEE